MAQLANIANDLAFVRTRVDRSDQSAFPSSILFLWAGIVLVGSVLIDVAPVLGGVFWIVAGPVGGVLSAILGWRWSMAGASSTRWPRPSRKRASRPSATPTARCVCSGVSAVGAWSTRPIGRDRGAAPVGTVASRQSGRVNPDPVCQPR